MWSLLCQYVHPTTWQDYVIAMPVNKVPTWFKTFLTKARRSQKINVLLPTTYYQPWDWEICRAIPHRPLRLIRFFQLPLQPYRWYRPQISSPIIIRLATTEKKTETCSSISKQFFIRPYILYGESIRFSLCAETWWVDRLYPHLNPLKKS